MNKKQESALKGLAIIAVVVIHFFASFKDSPYLAESAYQWFVVSLDQLFRLSVPLFVALSGYGLSRKYVNHRIPMGSFLFSRAKKLLPLYFAWCFISFVVFWLVPGWTSDQPQPHILTQVLLGRVDYHLYFVPMLFQLYLLFPFIYPLAKRYPLLMTLLAFAIQGLWYESFVYQNATLLSSVFPLNDKEQYVWAGNWIGYFVLGMNLTFIWRLFEKQRMMRYFLVGLFFVSLAKMIDQALFDISIGIDPLNALRFTRYSVMIYAFLGILASGWVMSRARRLSRVLVFLGEHSYYIYLSHTILLRIVFSL